jgi:phenylacetate-CoA ligase
MAKIGTTIRSAIYWGIDFFSGSPVRRHLHNIQLVSKNGSLLAEHQAQQLKSLLNHAVQTTDYYKNYDTSGMLKVFPVINKNIIRESFAQFQSSIFKGKKLKVMETSGSTGAPFRVVQDSNKRQRVLADLIEFNSLVGYRVGTRHAFFRTIEPSFSKSSIKRFMQNEIEFNVRLQDSVSFEQQRKRLLKDKNIEIIIAYSSVIYNLARHIISQGDTPKSFGVKGVLCLAEPLYPNMRDTIHKAFDCIVLSRYSNQECGVLAYECPICSRFHLNTASYFFETLDLDRDEPISPGTSGRIVVTDLYNYALPMIRYDTGDIGSVIPSDCPRFETPILQSLEGRKLDSIYDTAGRRLIPWVFNVIFETLNTSGVLIKQFQFIQEGKTRYRLRLCVNETFSQELFVVEQVKKTLGDDAQIEVEYVEEIPVLNSGKRKFIVSNYKPAVDDIPKSNMPR